MHRSPSAISSTFVVVEDSISGISEYRPYFLVVDTETTGELERRAMFPDGGFNVNEIDINQWPRMLQIAWAIHDSRGACLASRDFLVFPKDFEVEHTYYKIHGISTRLAKYDGVPIEEALKVFSPDIKEVDYIVGHCIPFDIGVIASEYLRANLDHPFELGLDNEYLVDTKSPQLRGFSKRSRARIPSLLRLHEFLFDEPIPDQHNATRDVVATARCLFELLRTKRYGIHYVDLDRIAKNINDYFGEQPVIPHDRPHINLRAKSEEIRDKRKAMFREKCKALKKNESSLNQEENKEE